jgi:hypothetical protein
MTTPIGDLVGGADSLFSKAKELVNPSTNEGAMYYAADGSLQTFQNGEWVTIRSVLGDDTTTASSRTSGASTPAYDPNDLAFVDSQLGLLRGMYADADTSYNQGLTGIENAYNKEYSDTNFERGRAVSDLDMKTQDTERGKDQALGQVDTYARTLADSVRRPLGMASGSDSSAYKIAAPGAVARDASGKREGVLEDYGTNFRNLDITKKRAKEDYDKVLTSLGDQKQAKRLGLEQGIIDQRNQISQQEANLVGERQKLLGGTYQQSRMAQQPLIDQINTRKASLTDLFNKYTPTYQKQNVVVNTPTLRDYMVDQTKVSGGNTAQEQYAPDNLPLNKEDEEQKNIYA